MFGVYISAVGQCSWNVQPLFMIATNHDLTHEYD